MYCVAMSKRLNCKLNIYDYVEHSFQHNDKFYFFTSPNKLKKLYLTKQRQMQRLVS